MNGADPFLIAFVSDNERAKGTRQAAGVKLSGTPILRPRGGAFRLFSAKAGKSKIIRGQGVALPLKKAVVNFAHRTKKWSLKQ